MALSVAETYEATIAEIQNGEPRLHRFARIDAISPIPND